MNIITRAFCAGLAVAFITAGSTAAIAAGESDGNGSDAAMQDCEEGLVWDPNAKALMGLSKGKCVKPEDVVKVEEEKQSLIYDYGKWLAKQGSYNKAITVLYSAPDQHDPRVLNYLGYSHRKLGKMDEALGYYKAAIAQNPDFSLVREYLGEAYIQLGMLEQAREQLTEIERICGGKSCGEYGQLANLIVDSQIAE